MTPARRQYVRLLRAAERACRREDGEAAQIYLRLAGELEPQVLAEMLRAAWLRRRQAWC